MADSPALAAATGARGKRYDVKFARWRSGHSALLFQPLIDTHNYSNGGFLNRSGGDVAVENREPAQTTARNCSQILAVMIIKKGGMKRKRRGALSFTPMTRVCGQIAACCYQLS